jgi:predicted PurR-regulated permease PerM
MSNSRRNILIAMTGFLLLFVYLVAEIMAPFVLAGILAYLLHPANNLLHLKYKINLSLSSALTLSIFFSGLILFLGLLGPLIYNQAANVVTQVDSHSDAILDKYTELTTAWLGHLSPALVKQVKSGLSEISQHVIILFGKFLQNIFKSGMAAISALSLIVITPVVTFYLLRDWTNIRNHIKALTPEDWKQDSNKLLTEIHVVLMSFLRGQICVCAILAVYYTLSFLFVDLHSWLALGILAGILVFIPYLGTLISTILCFTIALLQFGFDYQLLILVGILLTGQILEGMVVAPWLIGDSVGLHPIWIMFSLLASGALFGFVGIVMAVPCAALIGVIIRFCYKKW